MVRFAETVQRRGLENFLQFILVFFYLLRDANGYHVQHEGVALGVVGSDNAFPLFDFAL